MWADGYTAYPKLCSYFRHFVQRWGRNNLYKDLHKVPLTTNISTRVGCLMYDKAFIFHSPLNVPLIFVPTLFPSVFSASALTRSLDFAIGLHHCCLFTIFISDSLKGLLLFLCIINVYAKAFFLQILPNVK